jgi:hypothetical protein
VTNLEVGAGGGTIAIGEGEEVLVREGASPLEERKWSPVHITMAAP